VAQQLGGVAQRAREIRPAATRRERHEIADHAQGVGAALRGPHDVLRHVGEEQRADAIVVARRRERQHGGDLHGEARLGVRTAEMATTRIDPR